MGTKNQAALNKVGMQKDVLRGETRQEEAAGGVRRWWKAKGGCVGQWQLEARGSGRRRWEVSGGGGM